MLFILLRLNLKDGEQFLHLLLDWERSFVQFQFSLFQTGNFKDVIDQSQQMFAGEIDFLQIFLDLIRRGQMVGSKFGKTDNRIQRGTHVMRHVGEEHILCLSDFLAGFQRILQQLVVIELCLFFFFNVAETEDNLVWSK